MSLSLASTFLPPMSRRAAPGSIINHISTASYRIGHLRACSSSGGESCRLLEALLPPADRHLQALLARDLAELLTLRRMRHRRHAEHFLAVFDVGHQPAHV